MCIQIEKERRREREREMGREGERCWPFPFGGCGMDLGLAHFGLSPNLDVGCKDLGFWVCKILDLAQFGLGLCACMVAIFQLGTCMRSIEAEQCMGYWRYSCMGAGRCSCMKGCGHGSE